jgi:hypothetical protein
MALNTFFAPRFRLGWILLILGAFSSFFWFLFRWNFENTMRSVQLTVDYEDTRSLSDAFQVPHATLLQELKARGVTSVGVFQQTLGTLQGNGRITVTSRDEAQALYPGVKWNLYPPAYRFLLTSAPQNRELFEQVWTHLGEQAQKSLPPKRVRLGADALGEGILISASQQLRGDAQLGFDPAAVAAVKKAGLRPTARLSNALNLNMDRVRRLLDESQAIGARVIIFSEDEVLGYDSLIGPVAKEMRQRGLLFGNIEFTKQRGWPDFAARTEGKVVRVHSVGGDEAAKTKTHLLVDRFARSVKERNVRVAYIRLVRQFKGEVPPDEPKGRLGQLRDRVVQMFTGPPKPQNRSALQQNLDFVRDVRDDLVKSPLPTLRPALQLGDAGNFGEYPLPQLEQRWGSETMAKVLRMGSVFLAGLGALGGLFLLLNLFFDLSVAAKSRLLLFGLLAVGALSALPGKGEQILGLLAGCVVTPVALLWGGLPFLWDRFNVQQPPTSHSGQSEHYASPGRAFVRGSQILLQTTALTMLGPLLVVAIYNHWKFLSHTDEFFGEKGTLLFPLLLAAVAFSGQVFPHHVLEYGANEARRRAMMRAREALEQPFTMRVAAIGLLVAIAGYFFMARSGNESGMEISTLEWNFRSLMEQVFGTRPRTKEMFIGMPAMIFAVYFIYRRQLAPALGAVIAVAIGQADILNTFCHFWTPLFYSLLRTIHALWIGALLGGLGVWLWHRIERNFSGRIRPITFGSSGGNRPQTAPGGNGVAADSKVVR